MSRETFIRVAGLLQRLVRGLAGVPAPLCQELGARTPILSTASALFVALQEYLRHCARNLGRGRLSYLQRWVTRPVTFLVL
jgi:hypothetical protein